MKRRLFGLLIALGLCASLAPAAERIPLDDSWRDAGVVLNNHSPYAKLHSVPVRAVTLGPGFWAARLEANRKRSLPSLYQLLEEHGVLDNFRRVSGRKNVARRGPLYTDSDIYKWIEAAALTLQTADDPQLRGLVDRAEDDIVAAQQPDGYLNTYFILERAKDRFTNFKYGHELYCLGHLIQAAIADYRARGNRKLLDAAIRYADYVMATCGPDKKPAMTGHPEFEMALVELYRTTGDAKYVRFAGYLLSGVERERLRQTENLSDREIVYTFSGMPFVSRSKFEGHSVRAMYASAGAADYFSETGEAPFRNALETLWTDLTSRKMYVTGGLGSREDGEAIGEPYELPNEQAYTETCAAIGNFMWNWRMLGITGEARFADVMERALYNGILSGVSLTGDRYFYRNPLEALGRTERQAWYSTTCCPPNIERTLAALPGYFYSTSKDGLWVHLYHNSVLSWRLEDGTPIRITQKTEYPWKGAVELSVQPGKAATFTLYVRMPGWAQGETVTVDGKPLAGAAHPGSYVGIRRPWRGGERVRLAFAMKPQLLQANPRVREDFARIAVQRGPLVYCAEGPDQGQFSLFDVWLPVNTAAPASGFSEEFEPQTLGGVEVLRTTALLGAPHATQPLYSPLRQPSLAGARKVRLTLIPYYSWANRKPSEMQVWFPWVEDRGPKSKARGPRSGSGE